MSKKPKPSVLNMIERERHRVAAAITREQDWDQPEPNNGLARMFVIMLLIHVFVIGGIIIYDFVGGDSTPKASQAGGTISPARSTAKVASVPAAVPLTTQASLAAPRTEAASQPASAAKAETSAPAVAKAPESKPVPKALPLSSDTVMAPGAAPASTKPVTVAAASTTSPRFNDSEADSPKTAAHTVADQPPATEKAHASTSEKPKAASTDKPAAASSSRPSPVPTPSSAIRSLNADSKPSSSTTSKANKKKEDADAPPAKSRKKDDAESPPSKKSKGDSHGSNKHTVTKGDTFYKLARRYKVSEEALMKANNIKNTNGLVLGKTITIPASK